MTDKVMSREKHIKELQDHFKLMYRTEGPDVEDFKRYINEEAGKRGLGIRETIDKIVKDNYGRGKVEEEYSQFLEAYKLPLHEGINQISRGLQRIPGEFNGTNESLELKFGKNEYVRFKFNKDDNYKNLAKLSSTISKTFDFVLWKIGEAKDCFFSCDLNEYFDFIGVQREKKNIETLKNVLGFLSNCELFFKTKIKDMKTNKMKEVSGFGNAFAWTLVKHDPGNPNSQYKDLQIATTPTWAETIVNNKAFTKIDHMLPKVKSFQYPYVYMIGRKLLERYRNNARIRKGEEEVISLKVLLEAMILSKRLQSRGTPAQISVLEKSLDKLSEDKIIEWKYRDRYKNPKEKARGYIVYRPLSKDILSINKSRRVNNND